MSAGSLKERVAFDAPLVVPDGHSGTETGWEEKLVSAARFIYSRGSEAVEAARLSGRSVYKIKIRSSIAARQITSDWRMRDTRRGDLAVLLPGEIYNIREVDSITDPAWVYLTVESGVAS